MKVLGISGCLHFPKNHDAAAALVIDGKLVGNYEEERFNGLKHSVGKPFPIISIKKLLTENNLTLDDIDVIAAPHDLLKNKEYAEEIARTIDPNSKHIPKLMYRDHHRAHLCDSIFQSGFDSCACLVVDGQGDARDGITLAHYKAGEIEELEKFPASVSVGLMYSSAANDILSMGEFGEGKLMGLASYGKPTQEMPLYWENDTIKTRFPSYVSSEFTPEEFTKYEQAFPRYFMKHCYPYRQLDRQYIDNIMYYVDFAASVQKTYEDILMQVLKRLKKYVGNEENLILSGGCIQNCICNNLIIESGLFKNTFAGPAPHDAGCAAGLAFYGAMEMNDKIINKRTRNSYVGKIYSDKEILDACNGLQIEEYDETKLIKSLYRNNIYAWFQGGSEIGPRALGHRSLIANPEERTNLFRLNGEIKHREDWRPLAPVLADTIFDTVFKCNNYDLFEFMLRTQVIPEKWRKLLSAVCHVDYTTRPQRLVKEENTELWSLLIKYYEQTGVPGLINTSFNDRGQPIIETPETAVKFLKEHPELYGIVFNAKYIVTR